MKNISLSLIFLLALSTVSNSKEFKPVYLSHGWQKTKNQPSLFICQLVKENRIIYLSLSKDVNGKKDIAYHDSTIYNGTLLTDTTNSIHGLFTTLKFTETQNDNKKTLLIFKYKSSNNYVTIDWTKRFFSMKTNHDGMSGFVTTGEIAF